MRNGNRHIHHLEKWMAKYVIFLSASFIVATFKFSLFAFILWLVYFFFAFVFLTMQEALARPQKPIHQSIYLLITFLSLSFSLLHCARLQCSIKKFTRFFASNAIDWMWWVAETCSPQWRFVMLHQVLKYIYICKQFIALRQLQCKNRFADLMSTQQTS